MSEIEQVEFYIQVDRADLTDEELDDLTRQLLAELREMDVESVKPMTADIVPSGTKAGDSTMLGNLAVTVLPNILPKVVEGILAWKMRGQNRSLRFKGKVTNNSYELQEFEGSLEDLDKLLESLEKGRKKK